MEKLSMQTTDVVDENIKRIGELFPNCLTEVKDEKGRPQVAIDFDQLRQELSKNIVEGPEERYQFTWPDKRNAIRLANAPTTDTLRPCREESVDFDNTQNLYIEGDNLQVLKLLRENYLGKVKMIYIDPPYNTGNDFVYNDNFDQDKQEYVHNSGQYDEQGNQLVTNTESNGRFHTDWLNMIYPRLKVAKDLLSEDGVIFISIDDNEVDNLRKMCDEVLGCGNFLAQLVWEKKYTVANDAQYFSCNHDYIICYTKCKDTFQIGKLPRTEEMNAAYKNPDNHPKGPWKSTPLHARSGSEALANFSYTFKNGVVFRPPTGTYSRYSADTLRQFDEGNEIWFGYDGTSIPSRKTFLCDLKHDGVVPRTLIPFSVGGHNHEADEEVKGLLNKKVFTSPKPTKLLKHLLVIANPKLDSIVLDFFSGSATTAHAVMQLNAEDGGNRKFIMVQLPEATDEKSEAYKAGYKNICEIGKERIRRAGKKIKEENPEAKNLDTGFRVLKLDSSNMQDVYYTPAEFNERDLFEDNIKSDRTEEDLLFQTMIELGIELSAKIEQTQIAGKTVWNVSDGYLMACFDEAVNETTITEIAKQQPYYFVMRDKSLANDNVADNFEQIFNHYSKDTIRRII